MKIIKVGLGNTDEAYIESEFSDGINIIYSDENNKGKTIVIQSMLYRREKSQMQEYLMAQKIVETMLHDDRNRQADQQREEQEKSKKQR